MFTGLGTALRLYKGEPRERGIPCSSSDHARAPFTPNPADRWSDDSVTMIPSLSLPPTDTYRHPRTPNPTASAAKAIVLRSNFIQSTHRNLRKPTEAYGSLRKPTEACGNRYPTSWSQLHILEFQTAAAPLPSNAYRCPMPCSGISRIHEVQDLALRLALQIAVSTNTGAVSCTLAL